MVWFSRRAKRKIRQFQSEFERLAFELFYDGRFADSNLVQDSRIRSWCGCSSLVLAKAWFLLQDSLTEYATQQKFLWCMYFLSQYPQNDMEGASRCLADEKTYRRWVWFFVEELAYLEDDIVSDVSALILDFFLRLHTTHFVNCLDHMGESL